MSRLFENDLDFIFDAYADCVFIFIITQPPCSNVVFILIFLQLYGPEVCVSTAVSGY